MASTTESVKISSARLRVLKGVADGELERDYSSSDRLRYTLTGRDVTEQAAPLVAADLIHDTAPAGSRWTRSTITTTGWVALMNGLGQSIPALTAVQAALLQGAVDGRLSHDPRRAAAWLVDDRDVTKQADALVAAELVQDGPPADRPAAARITHLGRAALAVHHGSAGPDALRTLSL